MKIGYCKMCSRRLQNDHDHKPNAKFCSKKCEKERDIYESMHQMIKQKLFTKYSTLKFHNCWKGLSWYCGFQLYFDILIVLEKKEVEVAVNDRSGFTILDKISFYDPSMMGKIFGFIDNIKKEITI